MTFEGTISEHYSSLTEQDVKERQKSKIITLRCFNNFLKQILINKYANILKQQNKDKLVILDLCCGKGGDLMKWHHIYPSIVIFVDIAEMSVIQCKERYEKYVKKYNNPFKGYFIHADCCEVDLIVKLKELGLENIKFDIVSCQFALHYAFQSLERLVIMLKNATQSLKNSGFFIGIITDACKIINLLNNIPKQTLKKNDINKNGGKNAQNEDYTILYKFSNQICEISYDHPCFSKYKNCNLNLSTPTECGKKMSYQTQMKLPLFGANLSFYLEERVDCTEFLAYFPLLTSVILDKYGMICTLSDNLHTFYHNNRDASWDLAKKMSIYQKFHPDAVENETEFSWAQDFYKDVSTNVGGALDLQTISNSQWEVIGCYRAFAFRKISNR